MVNLALVKDSTLIYRLVYSNLSGFESRTGSLTDFMHTFGVFRFLYTSHMSNGRVALCEVTHRWWHSAEIAWLSDALSVNFRPLQVSCVQRPSLDVVLCQCGPNLFIFISMNSNSIVLLLENRENIRKYMIC